MGQFLTGEGSVMLVAADLLTVDNAEKVRGFQHCAATLFPALHIAAVIEDHESEEESYAKCRQALTANPSIKGIYVTTGNSLPVLGLLGELGLAGKLKVITTDLFPGLLPMLRSGTVAATIYQKPLTQGRIAFQTVYRFLTENVCPPALIRLTPRIVLRSNLKGFLDGARLSTPIEQDDRALVSAPV